MLMRVDLQMAARNRTRADLWDGSWLKRFSLQRGACVLWRHRRNDGRDQARPGLPNSSSRWRERRMAAETKRKGV